MMYAIWVLGPEGTGTRLMTRLLIRAGCLGSDQHNQPFDNEPILGESFPSPVQPLVWRRSFPHGGTTDDEHGILRHWPDIVEKSRQLENRGYTCAAVVMMRDFYATIQSQINTGVAGSEQEAGDQIRRAYREIFKNIRLADLAFTPVMYGALTHHPTEVLRITMGAFGLPVPEHSDIYDGDQKYY